MTAARYGMSETFLNIRDYQPKSKDDRTLEQQAIEIMNVAIIPHDAAIAEEYVAPETDPA